MQSFVSNSMEILSTLMLSQEGARPDPLKPMILVTPNAALAQWLALHRAKVQGVAGNLILTRPDGFFLEVARQILGPSVVPAWVTETRVHETLVWAIFHRLSADPSWSEMEVFGPYVTQKKVAERPERWVQISLLLAGIFGRYMTYRPKALYDWTGPNEAVSEEVAWQRQLWKEVHGHLKQVGAQWLDRAYLLKALQQSADRPEERSAWLRFPPTSFLTLGPLPELWWETLKLLSLHTSVSLFCLTPAPHEEERVQHFSTPGAEKREELLAFLGEEKEALLRQLHETGGGVSSCFYLPSSRAATRLARWKEGCLKGVWGEEAAGEGFTEDHSLSLHWAASRSREVELLYDRLLALMERDASLLPQDILVVVPDLKQYAPFLSATFSRMGRDQTHPLLPLAFKGGQAPSVRTHERLAFASWLKLVVQGETLEGWMQLFLTPAFTEAAGLSAEEASVCRHWMQWGYPEWTSGGEERGSAALPQLQRWLEGLVNRCFESDFAWFKRGSELPEAPLNFPLDEEAWEILSKLGRLLRRGQRLAQQLTEVEEIDVWKLRLKVCLNEFFSLESSRRLREWMELLLFPSLEALASVGSALQPFSVVYERIKGLLQRGTAQVPWLGGRAVVCGEPMAVRGVPFKVVAILGMNEGVFPSDAQRQSFDLLTKEVKETDLVQLRQQRAALIDLALSAGEVLYLSCLSGDTASGEVSSPSDSLAYFFLPFSSDQAPEEVLRRWAQLHTTYPFDPSAFGEGFGGESFLSEWCPRPSLSKAPFGTGPSCEVHPLVAQPISIKLSELQSFYENPFRSWAVQRLGVRTPSWGESLVTSSHRSRDRLLHGARREFLWKWWHRRQGRLEKTDQVASLLVAHGLLPSDDWGKQRFSIEWEQLSACAQWARGAGYRRADAWRVCETPWGTVRSLLATEGFEGPLFFTARPVNARREFSLWLVHLLENAILPGRRSLLLSWEGTIYGFDPMPKVQAVALLERLVAYYRSGTELAVFEFFLESALAWLHQLAPVEWTSDLCNEEQSALDLSSFAEEIQADPLWSERLNEAWSLFEKRWKGDRMVRGEQERFRWWGLGKELEGDQRVMVRRMIELLAPFYRFRLPPKVWTV